MGISGIILALKLVTVTPTFTQPPVRTYFAIANHLPMKHDNLNIDDIANIVQSDRVPLTPKYSQKIDKNDDYYPDALSTAGLILFVIGLSLATWFIIYAL